ncbi:hypothetical protein SAY86_027470 [Trapa natans]|uniref:GATA transcription factor n=1 Tax=Trapa natans TaxID=22666 RepID=A0AAN7KME7_TRANT|nr:hypothetical protein SAY86_027470 [Trapa natans]
MSTGPSHDNSNMEELDCASFFDHIDDLLDFPMNDAYTDAGLSTKLDSFHSIWPTGSDVVFSNNESDISAQLLVPVYEDIVELEWLPNFVEDSFSGGGSLSVNCSAGPNPIIKEEPFQAAFRTTSPVSVLESSSSSSPIAPNGSMIPVPGSSDGDGWKAKARSKRPRPATFNPRPAIRIMSPSVSSVAENLPPNVSPKALSDSENHAESRPAMPMIKVPKQPPENREPKKKKKVMKPAVANQGLEEAVSGGSPLGQAVRKCLHCEITKTPQWRAGPLGPKTLCNACGVRYKSGRLFPEYRPAASPTFVPLLHSNSHKKVLEMRGGKIAGPATAMADPPDLIPNPTIQLNCM